MKSVTGASGFLGQAICRKLSMADKVVGFDKVNCVQNKRLEAFIQGNVTNSNEIDGVLKKYRPDVVVHSAGIAHEKLNSSLTFDDYNQVNNLATKNLALKAAEVNPDVHFLFFSSVSVYGEKYSYLSVSEDSRCFPTSLYAESKLNAEDNLIQLYNKFFIYRISHILI